MKALPQHLTVDEKNLKLYFESASPRELAAWEKIITEKLAEWHIVTGEALVTAEEFSLLEPRQALMIGYDKTEGTAYLSEERIEKLSDLLEVEFKASAFAEYQYSEVFGRRNGLGILFTVTGETTARLENISNVQSFWLAQGSPLIFGVTLFPDVDPHEEATRITREMRIFLVSPPEEL